jgi:GT2 family glycosyltransferase
MNDDTVHDPQWLDRLILAALEDDLIGALQPKILSLKSGGKGKKVFDYAGAAGGMLDRLGYPYCLGRKFARLEFDQGQYDIRTGYFLGLGCRHVCKKSSG